jgi:hypothetical protein
MFYVEPVWNTKFEFDVVDLEEFTLRVDILDKSFVNENNTEGAKWKV